MKLDSKVSASLVCNLILQGFLLFFCYIFQVSGMYVAFFVVLGLFALLWIGLLWVGPHYSELTRRRLITSSTALLLFTAVAAYTIEFRCLGSVSPVFSTVNNHLPSSEEVSQYLDGGVRINLPVTQELGGNGLWVEHLFNDGGTKMIRIVDAEGRTFDVYIDHRIGKEREWGTVYLKGYPGSPNSVRVRDQDNFKRVVLKGLRY